MASSRKDVILRHRRKFHPDSINNEITTRNNNSSTRSPKVYPFQSNDAIGSTTQTGSMNQQTDSTVSYASIPNTNIERLPPEQNALASPPSSRHDETVPNALSMAYSNMENGFGFDNYSPIFLEDWMFPLASPPTTFHGTEIQSDEPRSNPLDQHCHPQPVGMPSANDYEIHISEAEMELVNTNIRTFAFDRGLPEIQLVTKYGVIRYLRAFFRYFAPHAPMVPMQTFNITNTHPILALTIFSIGARYADEHDMAFILHNTANKLLSRNDQMMDENSGDICPPVWELQSRLLLCYSGFFSGNHSLQQHALQSFHKTIDVVGNASSFIAQLPQATWTDWIHRETITRCAAMCTVLAALFISDQENVSFNTSLLPTDIPLPSSEEDWKASASTWFLTRVSHRSLSKSLEDLMSGKGIEGYISAFGLLTLAGALVCHICSSQSTMAFHSLDTTQGFFSTLDASLRSWEESWKRHPHSSYQFISAHGPIMGDALALLNIAYYHIHGGRQLKFIRRFLKSNQEPSSFTFDRDLEPLEFPGLEKAINRAAMTIRLRSRFGISYLKRTGALTFAPYQMLSGFESCLLICWYLLAKRKGHISAEAFATTNAILEESILELRQSGLKCNDTSVLIVMGFEELSTGSYVWQSKFSFFVTSKTAKHYRIPQIARSDESVTRNAYCIIQKGSTVTFGEFITNRVTLIEKAC